MTSTSIPTRPALPAPTLFELNKGSWKLFLKRMENIFVTYETKSEDVKKGYLLASLGDQAYALLHNLCVPKEPEDSSFTFSTLSAKLTEHLKPVQPIFSARQEFYLARQLENETVMQFSARLRSLAMSCKFSDDFYKNIVRDIFVIGIRDFRIKERLFEEDPSSSSFDLAKSIEIAANREAATQRSIHAVDNGLVQVKTEPTDLAYVKGKPRYMKKGQSKSNENKKTSANIECTHCGWKTHDSRDCRFKNALCHRCSSTGHIASVCKFRKKGTDDTQHKFLKDDTEIILSDSFYCLTPNLPSPKRPPPFIVSLDIANTKLDYEVDTGSTFNVMSHVFYKGNFKNYPLTKNDVSLNDYVGNKIKPIGKVCLPVKHENYSGDMEFYVIEGGGPPLIGRNGLARLKDNSWMSFLYQQEELFDSAPEDIRRILNEFPNVFKDKCLDPSEYHEIKFHREKKTLNFL